MQGHRHAAEYAIQATYFRLSADHYLVRKSDLLLYSNNGQSNATALDLYMSLYPHARKEHIISARNSGKRCGHLEAIAEQYSCWRCYSWVLFLHPDVYLTPGAFATLGMALQSAESTAFFVAPLNLNGHGELWNTDLFMWRPQLLHPATTQDTVPPHQRAAHLFQTMCINASILPHGAPPYTRSPERSFYRAVHAARHLSWCELRGKKAFWNRIDAIGAWHFHLAQYTMRFVQAVCSPRDYRALVHVLHLTMARADFDPLVADIAKIGLSPGMEAEVNRSIHLKGMFSASVADGTRVIADAMARNRSHCVNAYPTSATSGAADRFAGGSGSTGTAGLGGRGGPYHLDVGQDVHLLSEAEKAGLSASRIDVVSDARVYDSSHVRGQGG